MINSCCNSLRAQAWRRGRLRSEAGAPPRPRNLLFSWMKANGIAVPGPKLPRPIRPQRHERESRSSVKHRLSPLVSTDLKPLLRGSGIDTLVLAGVHTSGVVLSTVRHAGDLDYRLVVVRDCCAYPDAEAHAMLLDIVLLKQAAVVTMAEFAGALPGRSS
jgi:nicotinamidase-related amidase